MVWRDIETIRRRSPLVHNITNYVVMNTTANALLALGASPVMAHALDEVEEMVALAGALVINIGTLDGPWIEAMLRAGRAARARGVPVVLDPVGSGATRLRTQTALRFLAEAPPSIVRGNASEIASLSGPAATTRGVDSTVGVSEVADQARALSERFGCAVAVSGAVDLVVGPRDTFRIHNGHPMMTRVTGMGCTATALTGAFAAVNPNPAEAAAHALVVNGIAGEIAAEHADGPGSLQVRFLDTLYHLSAQDIAQRTRMDRK